MRAVVDMRTIASPIGPIRLYAESDVLVGLYMAKTRWPPPKARRGSSAILARAAEQLDEYFAGNRRDFDLPLAPRGTAFQTRVWNALQRVTWGQTCSYRALADKIGHPTAVRAVGAANGRNPISIIIPCHRLIGSDGSLTGYGGGVATKRWLLEHEGG